MFASRAAIVALFVLGMTATALADPRPMTAGGHLRPLEDVPVALETETLVIEVGERAVTVEATMTLRNTGDATASFRAGFPCLTNREGKGVIGLYDLKCKTKPTVRVAGKKQRPRKLPPGKVAEAWWAWPMSLDAGTTTELVVSYALPLVNDRYGSPSRGLVAIAYKLVTGATWAGPIRKLDIEVRLPHATVAWIAPVGAERELGVVRWALKDVDPTEDLVVYVLPGPYAPVTDRERAERSLLRSLEDVEVATREAHFFLDRMGQHYTLNRPAAADVKGVLDASLALVRAKPAAPEGQ